MNYRYICADRVLVGSELIMLHDGCVVINGEKIESIQPRNTIELNPGVANAMVNLGDVTLMPGMIECHNHLALDARLPGHLEMMELSECEHTVLALTALRDDLMSGVTTARCLGDRHYIDVVLRELVERGAVVGPRLLACGIGMRSVHGHGYVGIGHYGVEDLSRTARQNIARKVDFLKIFVTPGCPPVDGSQVPSHLDYDSIKAVVTEGKSLGLKTAAHCIGGKGLRDCLAAGVEVIEHAYVISDEELELVKKHDCWVDLTSGIFLDPGREPFCSPDSVRNTRMVRERVADCMRKLLTSGVKYTIGTDAYHTYLHKEVEIAVDLGANPVTALQAVTSNAAKMCGISDKTGSLQPGLAADIIAVKGNPVQSPASLAEVAFVMKSGQIYKDNSTQMINPA